LKATTVIGPAKTPEPQTVFSRVLVGIDGSAESREAARQAALLLDEGGRLTLLAAYDIAPALVAGTAPGVPAYLDEDAQRKAAEEVLRAVRGDLQDRFSPAAKVVRGRSWEELLGEAERGRHTLIAVGSHGIGRARGIVVGSTATEVVHKASCSVLVARKAGPHFPRRIVVGVDGSPESAAAYAAAQQLTGRFGAELWPVVAQGGKGVDKRLVATIVDHRHEDLPDEPAQALVAAAADADLVVVGSRGLHGVKSLGSVSERVAHEARSSVLIVRGGDRRRRGRRP
jgi:nucleotide-binding universal stress UspA family protein